MSDASAVKQVILNTKTVFNTSAAINRVKIHNDSSMYLRVYFGSDAPLNATDNGWHDTIGPGGSPLMAVVGANASVFSDRTNYIQSTPYIGVIVVMPFLPVGAPVPAGGVVTGASLCYLTGYYPFEEAEAGGQVEAFVQAAKQGRFQEAGPGGVIAGLIPIDQTATNGTLTLLDSISGSASGIYQANVAGASVINLYLFGWGVSIRNNNPNLANIRLQPSFAITDVTGAVVRQAVQGAPQIFARALNFEQFNCYYIFPNPLLMQFQFLQGVLVTSDTLRYRISTIGGDIEGVFDGAINFAYLIDKVNQTPLLAIPNYPAPAVMATTSPYNSVYNPQTY